LVLLYSLFRVLSFNDTKVKLKEGLDAWTCVKVL